MMLFRLAVLRLKKNLQMEKPLISAAAAITQSEVATLVANVLGKEEIVPEITGKYRVGDIRHCFADITLARRILGYEPKVTLEDGLGELADWLQDQAVTDRVVAAIQELASRGLTI